MYASKQPMNIIRFNPMLNDIIMGGILIMHNEEE